MGPWSVMYIVYEMYCVGLIIINNTRSKRVNKNIIWCYIYMPNFMFVGVSVIEIL